MLDLILTLAFGGRGFYDWVSMFRAILKEEANAYAFCQASWNIRNGTDGRADGVAATALGI